jgi:hypothetical protein
LGFIHAVIVLFHLSFCHQANDNDASSQLVAFTKASASHKQGIVRTDSRISHKVSVLLPLIRQIALQIIYGAFHQFALKVTLDFLSKVRKWFWILIDRFLNSISEGAPLADPSVVGDILERSFELC